MMPQFCVALIGIVFQRFRPAVCTGHLLKKAACGLRRTNPVQWQGADLKVGLMTKLLLCALLVAVATPAWSQTKPAPKAARVDPCAPIGQTANRELVYSMSCNTLPAPPPLPPQAEAPPPPPEPETQRSGLFGMSLDRIGSPGAGGRTP
jgi:hypothetical protein